MQASLYTVARTTQKVYSLPMQTATKNIRVRQDTYNLIKKAQKSGRGLTLDAIIYGALSKKK